KGAGRMPVERDGAVGVGQCLDVVAGEVVRPGTIVKGQCRGRRQLGGAGVVGDGAGKVEPLAFGVTAVNVGLRRARIEPDGLIEIGNRALVLALGLPGAAPVIVGRRRRIEFDRLIIIGDRAIEVAFAPPSDAAIVERDGIARIDAQGLAVVGYGVVWVTFVVESVAAIVVGDDEFRI